MSTRAIIARATRAGWYGRYHHFDGYPTGLGAALWAAYHGHFQRDVDAMTRYLLDDHPAGWSTIVGEHLGSSVDFRLPAGWHGFNDEGRNSAPSCYCHGRRSETEDFRTQDDEPGDIEWLYVMSRATLSVYKTVSTTFDDPEGKGGDRSYRWIIYPKKFVCIAVLSWSGEPDWERLQAHGYDQSNNQYKLLEGETTAPRNSLLIPPS